MANLDQTMGSVGTSQEVTSWTIKAFSKEETKEEQKSWQEHIAGRKLLGNGCSTEELVEEAV